MVLGKNIFHFSHAYFCHNPENVAVNSGEGPWSHCGLHSYAMEAYSSVVCILGTTQHCFVCSPSSVSCESVMVCRWVLTS